MLGGTWVLNIAQVYSTLSRLEHEGLIEATVITQERLPDRRVYSLTDRGHTELDRWTDEPVTALIRLRDEAVLKVIARALVDPDRALSLVADQRDAYEQATSQLTKQRNEPSIMWATGELLDALLLRLEADLQWLDLVEADLKRKQRSR